MLDDFLKKHRIDKLYKFYTIGRTKIQFGWAHADAIDLTKQIVITYPSKSKSTSVDDRIAARSAGRSATTLADYHQYFVSLTGLEVPKFLEKYQTSEALAEDTEWPERQVLFLHRLAEFLNDQKTFNLFGFGYKIVEYGDERGNEKAEVQQEEG